MTRPSYPWRLLIALDQFANTVLGGDPDETVSSRCFKTQGHCRLCRWLCAVLEKIQPGHCRRSAEPDRGEAMP